MDSIIIRINGIDLVARPLHLQCKDIYKTTPDRDLAGSELSDIRGQVYDLILLRFYSYSGHHGSERFIHRHSTADFFADKVLGAGDSGVGQ
jgi:hypothetical protein